MPKRKPKTGRPLAKIDPAQVEQLAAIDCPVCGSTERYVREEGGTRCAPCARRKATAYRAAHPEEIRAQRAMYYAGHSGAEKARRAAYHVANLTRMKAAQAGYRRAHLNEKHDANAARYRTHKVAMDAAASAWRKAHPKSCRGYEKKYRQSHPEIGRLSGARYARTNPEKMVAKVALRRARKLAAPGVGVSADEWFSILADSLGLCAYCNEHKLLTMDHIEPLVIGGAHERSNIAAACKSCNSRKGDTPLVVWLTQRRAA